MKITTKVIAFAIVWVAISFVGDANSLDADQKLVQPLTSSSQSLGNVWTWISDSRNHSESNVSEGRTFGRIKKMQSMLIPLAFKFGVISTLIGVLVFLALKSVFLLKTLLLINVGLLFAKFFAYKASVVHEPAHGSHYFSGQGWTEPHPHSKEVHVHIHNPGEKSNGWHPESHALGPYSAYSRNDVSYGDPVQDSSPAATQKNSIHRTFKIV